MAFDPLDVLREQPLDFALVQNGPVVMFWRPRVLERTAADLVAMGYAVVWLDAAAWRDDAALHQDVARALDFPDYYGRNLDALNDCQGDVVEGAYGWDPHATGLAVAIRHWDALHARDPRTDHQVIDIATCQSRTGLLFGHRMLWLLQVGDPNFTTDPVGATAPGWNPQEWVTADRQPDSKEAAR